MSRRTALGIGTAGVLLLALGGPAAGSPGAGPAATTVTAARARALLARVASEAPAQPADLVNDEVGIAELDPTGLPERAVLISRVTASGPARQVVDPSSQTNVRYLDRLGRPEVTPDGVLLTVGGDDPDALTQSRFDIPLPVALHVEYALDGAVVPATAVPGGSGELAVTYTLTSTDAQLTELRYVDAAGTPQRSTRPVFPPFQGDVTVTLPHGSTVTDADDAVMATDANGRTVLRWPVSLYPPISAPIQAFTVTMRTERAAIPGAEVTLAPVRVDQDPADQFSADLLAGATEGNEALFDGLAELDASAAALAAGSAQMAFGLGSLTGGAEEVAGASDALADGVGELAGGANQLADASAGLAAGVSDLSGGADELASGTAGLSAALDQAVDGADELARVTQVLAGDVGGDGQDPVAPLIAGGEQIEAGLARAAAQVGGPADPVLGPAPLPPDGDDSCPAGGTAPPDDDCVTLYQGVRLLRDSLAGLEELVGATNAQAQRAEDLVGELRAQLGSLGDDLQDAARGSATLLATLCDPASPSLDPASCAQLGEVARSSASALATGGSATATLVELVVVVEVLQRQAEAMATAVRAAVGSAQRLLDAVAALGTVLGQGTAAQPGLAAAMAQLNEGLRQLSADLAASQAQLATALSEVASGNATLAAGLGTASSGAEDLASGSGRLAEGAGAAASGAEQVAGATQSLADGARGAATGADQLARGTAAVAGGTRGAAAAGTELASGARTLQQDGTGPAAESVLDASTDPAEAQAWLAAADARAADALPYGAPEGAAGNVAYWFTLEPVAARLSLWDRIRGMFG